MDFDFIFAGQEVEYQGKKYMFIKTISSEYQLVAEVGAEMPTPALVIPIIKKQPEVTPHSDSKE